MFDLQNPLDFARFFGQSLDSDSLTFCLLAAADRGAALSSLRRQMGVLQERNRVGVVSRKWLMFKCFGPSIDFERERL